MTRSAQARATQRAIVAAASELFIERGFAATTIDAVAERAGVGRKTIFSSVGGKGALLKLAWDWAITGDDEPVPMSERPAVRAILAERDPDRLVRMWVDMLLAVAVRAAPLAGVVLVAADVDVEARALHDLTRTESLAGATAFVTHVADVGALRSDSTVERGADTCWALVNSLLFSLLVDGRGWRPSQYGDWLVQVVTTSLLEPDRGPLGSPPVPQLRVTHEPASGRYVASADGRPAGHLLYERTDHVVVVTSTEVHPDFDGDRVADTLVRRAMDDVLAAGTRRVVPWCPYVAWWLARHPAYAPLTYDAGTGDRWSE